MNTEPERGGDAAAPVTVALIGAGNRGQGYVGWIARHRDLLLTLGRVSEVNSADAAPAGAVTFVSGSTTAALSLAGIIDLTAERARLEKEIAVFDSDIGHVNKKLGNPNFVSRAAPEVVDEQRAKLAEAEEGKVKLQAALARLDAMAGA